MHSIIISRIIEAGYEVFIPIHGGSELILRTKDGEILRCKAQAASVNEKSNPVLKKSEGFDVLAAFDPLTKNVWIIPSEVIEGLTAIRLGKKYDDYLIPEPRSMEHQERKKAREGYLEELRKKAIEVSKEGAEK